MRARTGDGPRTSPCDIDVLDPASGTPEVDGLYPREALSYMRALPGTPFTGFDVVEVSPAYDGPVQLNALHAAAYEMLAMLAVAPR